MNKKWLAIGIILLFMGTYIVPATAQNVGKQSTSRGNWLYVGGSGPGNYTRIQDAIDNARDGDIVFVFNGTYYENIVISKSINLEGESKLATIIYGSSASHGVIISAQYVKISNFTIENSRTGIRIGSNYSYISNNIIKQNKAGIDIYSGDNTISNNIIIFNDETGIFLCDCSSTIIQRNTISDVYRGIDIWDSKFCNIIENNISFTNESIRFVTSWFNKVTGNIISNNWIGVLVLYSLFNTIKKNNFIGNNKYHALFVTSFSRWTQNYWDNCLGLGIKPIVGLMYFEIQYSAEYMEEISIPWIQFDWRPVQKPYDIPGMS